jgi:hypothetical protein
MAIQRHTEPIPAAKRQPAIVAWMPDLDSPYAKLHLQWISRFPRHRPSKRASTSAFFPIGSALALAILITSNGRRDTRCKATSSITLNGMRQDLLQFPGYISDFMSFLVENESPIINSSFLSAFLDRLLAELSERELWTLTAAFACVLRLFSIALTERTMGIELPLNAKKNAFEVNRESLAVTVQILTQFGVEILLRSYLIEFGLAFRSFSNYWPDELPANRVWELFAALISLNLDMTIAIFGLYFG